MTELDQFNLYWVARQRARGFGDRLTDAEMTARAAQQHDEFLSWQAGRGAAWSDVELLVEAYRYGQFADDMLDQPSPSCRSPGKAIREALRRVLDQWNKMVPPLKIPKAK